MKVFQAFIVLGLWSAMAQELLYRIPESMLEHAVGAVRITYQGEQVTYVEGFGWLPQGPALHPLIVGDEVFLSEALLQALPLEIPRLIGFRSSEGESIRIVLEFAGVAELEEVRREGRLDEREVLRLELPDMLVPTSILEGIVDLAGIEVALDRGDLALLVSGRAMAYRTFFLRDPARVVVDLDPLQFAEIEPLERLIRPGVLYRRFAAPTSVGSSGVHLIEIAPGYGYFQVVGESHVAGPLSGLAGDGLAAINAGYFDTRTFGAIGFLQRDGALYSLPSRNRASIGFGRGITLIDRVKLKLEVRVNGVLHDLSEELGLAVHTIPGREAGNPERRALIVSGKRVANNGFGPVRVPEDGFVITYLTGHQVLGWLRAGDEVTLEMEIVPRDFGFVRYAVEAGPLLVYDGRAAFEPGLEAFFGDIVEKRTQQAAIGVRADGTVLLLTGDSMRALELVPLFLSLGAERAMRLDSGSSTTLFAAGEVLNRSFQRPIVTAIVFVPYLP